VVHARPQLSRDPSRRRNETDHEKFKNVAAGVQSLVLSVGLIVGGVWSAWVLGGVARSQIELAKLRRDLEGTIALEISIDTRVLDATEGQSRDLVVEVSVKNPGTNYVYLDLREPALQVQRVRFHPESGLSAASDPIATHYYGPSIRPYQGLNLVAGASRVISFYLRVPSPGLYMVTFRSPIAPDLERKLEALPVGVPNPNVAKSPATWVSHTFINVQ
jgi:hypothetical protein